jgi:hypothetical protein
MVAKAALVSWPVVAHKNKKYSSILAIIEL